MKKILALVLAVLMAFSVMTITAGAEDVAPQKVWLYDLLKHSTDHEKNICSTVEVFFQNQLTEYNSEKKLCFLNEDGTVAAVCRPYEDNNRKYDLLDKDGNVGVKLNPTHLYFLYLEEGVYATKDGIPSAEYTGEYTGVYLTGNTKYAIKDLGIGNYMATKYDKYKAYSGKLFVGGAFSTYQADHNTVELYKGTDKKKELLGTYHITGMKNGAADVDFGLDGIAIDKYETYTIRVKYGSFVGKDAVNNHSEYVLSGKRLLGLREDYPAIDVLITIFGADSKVIGAIPTILNVLSFVKIVEKGLVKDVEKYIKAKKEAAKG